MMIFWKKLTVGNLVCIKTCYSFKPAKPFSITKNRSPKIVTVWNHLNWCLMAHWLEIAHFSRILLSHIFPLDRNDTSNHKPKANHFKITLIWEKMFQLGRPSMIYVVARSRQIMRIKKEKKNKEKLIVMSCTWKIWSSLNENQEKMLIKWWKITKTQIISPLARNYSSV